MSPRVLYLTHRVPFPPDKGDRIRNYHVLRQLAARAKVWLVALADEPVTEDTRAALAGLCERVELVPVGRFTQKLRAVRSALRGGSLSEGAFHSSTVADVLRRWSSETTFTAALVSAGPLAPYLLGKGLERIPGFVDLVDVDSQKWLDFADASGFTKRMLYQFEARRLRYLERRLPEWTSAVSIVSEHEAKVFESFAGTGTATVATNGVDLEYFRPVHDVAEEPACAFVGALDYLPNVDAAVWFANDVWPVIRAKHPTAEFWVIGRKPMPAIVRLGQRSGITIVGQVPDVRPYVARAAVVVVPMRLSRGLQNKVLEALAMAKAVVASPPALTALETVPGTHLLQAQTPTDWADAVGELLASPNCRRELGDAGRRYVEDRHHWDRCLRPLLDKLLDTDATRCETVECHTEHAT